MESLKTAIVELLHILGDVFAHSEALFGRDVRKVVQQPIDVRACFYFLIPFSF